MVKRELITFLMIISVLLAGLFVSAAENTSEDNNSDSEITIGSGEESKIDNAYNCIKEKTSSCDDLSIQEKIFSVMSTGRCQNELINEKTSDDCWSLSSSTCDIKTTAQAILALRTAGVSVSDSEDWLIQQNSTPEGIDWFLQVESKEATSCSVSSNSDEGSFDIKEDKTLTPGAGSCFSLARDNYWLKISPNCYSEEFKISCDKSFQTSLLFKKHNSNIFHVSENTDGASAEGETTVNVNSFCFSNPGSSNCDYEGSLWSSFVLYEPKDVSPFVPYLVTLRDDYSEFLPEAFLYYITANNDFKNEVFQKQKDETYWDFSGDKFYDTAIALTPFQYGDPIAKQNAKEWLLEPGVQEDSGCWNNLANTGFILSTVWPRQFSSAQDSDTQVDCQDSGYHCLSEAECTGEKLNTYSCAGALICCSEPEEQLTCSEEGGETCSSNEECEGERIYDVPDLNSGEICCDGTCEAKAQVSECKVNGGDCYSSCTDNEEELIEYSDSCPSGQICCVEKSESDEGGFGWLWIILLLILIILVVLGIIFKDKLRPYWFKLKSKFSKSGGSSTGNNGSGPGRRGPPGRPQQPRNMPRRPQQAPRPGMPQGNQGRQMPRGDLDNTLQRLKEKSQ